MEVAKMNFGGGERSNKTRNKLVLICFYTICKIYKIQHRWMGRVY